MSKKILKYVQNCENMFVHVDICQMFEYGFNFFPLLRVIPTMNAYVLLLANLLTFYLAYLLAFYLTYLLAFDLTFYLAFYRHIFWHIF